LTSSKAPPIGKTPDAAASHSVSAKKSAGEKTPKGPRTRQIAGKNGRSNLPKADLTAGNVGRISGQRHSEKSGYGWLGRQDSNLGMVESKSTALPLGDAPAGGRTIVISPEGRYCGLTPPQHVPAVGRARRGLCKFSEADL
jgi:hypothetical protein